MGSNDYCAPCFVEWQKQPIEDRKKTRPARKVTTVNKIPVCGPHAEAELKRIRGDAKGAA